MNCLKSLELALLVGFVIFTSTCSELPPNGTDCGARRHDQEDGCSRYALVGECNSTTGICNCDVYTADSNGTTESLECFYYDPSTNFCQLRNCWHFSNSSGECRRDTRRRVVALLLSIFLINFGAANFYIERYDLAVPQIILGLLLCFFQCASCAVARKRDDDTSALCIFCCSVNSFVSLLFFAWWLADLIIFALNSRDDGDGCPLST